MAVSAFHRLLEKLAGGLILLGIPAIIMFAIMHSVQLAKVQDTADDNEVKIMAMQILLSNNTDNHAAFREALEKLKVRLDLHEESTVSHIGPTKGNK